MISMDDPTTCPRCGLRIYQGTFVNHNEYPLQSVITWVPVSERLPEDGRTKLIICGPYIVTAWWNPKLDAWTYGSQIWDAKHVTHWAELPTPPASEEGEG